MAFWNRKKKRAEDEALIEEAERRFEQIRAQRKAEKENTAGEELKFGSSGNGKNIAGSEEYQTEKIKPSSKDDQKRYVTECCQSIKEVDRQIKKIRDEYQNVTDYLKDIQKIDRVAGEERVKLNEYARNIVRLNRERSQYKNRNLAISDAAIRRLELYDTDLVAEIRGMYAAETYQKALDGDLKMLHEEKGRIREEKKEIVEKQNSLKGMAKVLTALIISLFVLFVVIYYALKADMTLPYLGTVFLAAISATVIFLESNRNHRDMLMADRKMDKAISLLNRVKIKCVNNLNLLEYNKEKFGVKDAADFEHLWQEYCKAKEYERKFKENTEQLHYYNEKLLEFLREQELKDCEIWLGQVIAITDDREMVEIRHRLNGQRQKLREQIAYNQNVQKGLVEEIDHMIAQHPENRKEIMEVVKPYSNSKD